MLDPIADKLLVSTCLLLLAADTDRTIAGWSLWAAIIILCREILVSGLREYLAELKVSVPVTRLAKWKTTIQMVAIAVLLAGPALDKMISYATETGIALLWIVGAGHALHRLRLFPRRPEAHHGGIDRDGSTKLIYFAWVRERIGMPGEEIALPAEIATVKRPARLPAGRAATATRRRCAFPKVIRVAIDQEHVEHDDADRRRP